MFCSNFTFGQRISVSARTDKNKIEIGQQIRLSLSVNAPQNLPLDMPALNHILDRSIEIVETSKIDTTFLNDNSYTLKQEILLTSYDSGNFTIPALPLVYRYRSATDTIFTEPIYLKVDHAALNPGQEIRDIKPPLGAPFNFAELITYLFYFLMVLVFIAGSIYAYKYFNKKNSGVAEKTYIPAEPAHIIALREMDQLKEDNLLQKNRIREFHSRLTDNIRRYIENRFKIQAMEQTSEEILVHMNHDSYTDKVTYRKLEEILHLADQVKFAKVKPTSLENARSLENAYKFIHNTKEVPNTSDEV
jgi:cbb3-type cytochrome oxidase subunit 3